MRKAANYGQGQEAGNEAGYIVGISTAASGRASGPLVLFYSLVAEHQQSAGGKPPGLCFSFPVSCEQVSSF